MLEYAALWSRLTTRPLQAEPWAVANVLGVLAPRLGIATVTVEQFGELHPVAASVLASTAQDRIREARQYRVEDGVAVVPVIGSLVTRSGSLRPASGMTGYNAIGAEVDRAVADRDVRAIALEIDSPGGETGVHDLARRIRAAAVHKPVWAIVADEAFSAAYAIASGATRILVPSEGGVGSIGVLAIHRDTSGKLAQEGVTVTILTAGARKADGHPFGPLPAEVASRWQARIDRIHAEFVGLVATHRGLGEGAVRATEADLFYGADAVRLGLADAVMPAHEALQELKDLVNRGRIGRPAKEMGMTQPSGAAVATAAAPDIAGQLQEARRQGASDERARIAAILRHAEAGSRPELAQSLALDTDLSPEQAGKVLTAAPKAAAAVAAGFAAAMARLGNPQVGADAGEGLDEVEAMLARTRAFE